MNILQLCYKTNEVVSQFDLFEEIARTLAPDHHFIFGVLTGTPDAKLADRVGCATEYFQLSKRDLKPYNIATLLRLLRYIRANRIDVVITHRYKPCLLAALISPLLPHCRFISVFHGYKQFDRRSRQWLARLFFNRRWQVVAVSEAVRTDLIVHKIPAQRIVVIPNAIDIEGIQRQQYSRQEARNKLGLAADAVVIGSLGGTRAIKGHRYLLEAFARIAPRYPQLHLLLLGGGDLEEALRAQAEQLGIAARTTITGMIANGYRYLPALDIFALPSLSEGLPIALLEAMATRLPAVATRVGGIPETVDDLVPLVSSRDAEQLAGALASVLDSSPAQRAACGDALYQRLRDHFAIEHYRRRYRTLINPAGDPTVTAAP